jgi:hypothetical protein
VAQQRRSRIIESDRLDFGPAEVNADPRHFAQSLLKKRASVIHILVSSLVYGDHHLPPSLGIS